MITNPKLPIDFDEKKQVASDVAKRALSGCFIYLLCWSIIILPTGFFRQEPVFVIYFSVILLVLGMSRYMLINRFEKIYSKNPLIWTSLLYFSVLVSGFTWGLLYSISITNPGFSSISFLIVISLAGITAAGSAAFPPDLKLALSLICVLLVPPMITIVFFSAKFDLALYLLFFSYIIGMFSVSNSQNKEYWKALKSSALLMSYASELEKLNTLDGLTGLKNRKYFDEELVLEIKRAERRKTEISLLIMDIDHFKSINDTYGHLAGDHCLKTIADIFKNVVKRETDTIARYGGEEFAVVLPGISEKQALELAEKVRLRVEETEITWNSASISLTISIGVSTIQPKKNYNCKLFINAADEALYCAKNEGRNRVSLSAS